MFRLPALILLFTVAANAVDHPLKPSSELYSPLIASKISATAKTQKSVTQYPQNTDTSGTKWVYFPANYWTSGFFPATLYAMNERASLCPTKGDSTDWVKLARAWSSGLIGLETKNTLGHDVGFMSFPFSNELVM